MEVPPPVAAVAAAQHIVAVQQELAVQAAAVPAEIHPVQLPALQIQVEEEEGEQTVIQVHLVAAALQLFVIQAIKEAQVVQ